MRTSVQCSRQRKDVTVAYTCLLLCDSKTICSHSKWTKREGSKNFDWVCSPWMKLTIICKDIWLKSTSDVHNGWLVYYVIYSWMCTHLQSSVLKILQRATLTTWHENQRKRYETVKYTNMQMSCGNICKRDQTLAQKDKKNKKRIWKGKKLPLFAHAGWDVILWNRATPLQV